MYVWLVLKKIETLNDPNLTLQKNNTTGTEGYRFLGLTVLRFTEKIAIF